jgi:hypothetical protein
MAFVPTWLYIKQHNVTGLLYFGKTIQPDVAKYKGSGKYWKSHLKQNGNEVTTIWAELFSIEDELLEFAQFFTEFYDVVKSTNSDNKKTWANLVPEDGKMGGQNAGIPSPMIGKKTGRPCVWKGKKRPDHAKTMTGKVQTAEHIANRSAALKQHKRTVEHGNAISAAKAGIPNPKLSLALAGREGNNKGLKLATYKCIHCGTEASGGNLARWHNDNCKYKEKENGKSN